MMILRESVIMKIHYGTAIGALFLTVIHIMMRMTQDFHESLEYENVIANYESVGYAILLELLLILISVHGFNGLRVILLEMNQGPTYEKAVTIGCLAGMAALIGKDSKELKEAFGEETVNSYLKLKTQEVDNFYQNENFNKDEPVTVWEKNNTLDC